MWSPETAQWIRRSAAPSNAVPVSLSGKQHDKISLGGLRTGVGPVGGGERPVSCRVEVDRDSRGAQVTGRATVHWHHVVFRGRAVDPKVSRSVECCTCVLHPANNTINLPRAACARASGSVGGG